MAGSFLSPSWYRVAALCPQLRSHLRVRRQRFRGRPWYVLGDPASGKLHRFSPAACAVIQRLDGQRSVDAIWREVAAAAGVDAPTQDEVIGLLARLHAGDLLQSGLPPDVAELGARGARQKRHQLRQRFLNPLAVRLPLWDPDAFLERHWPAVAWLFGPAGVLLWLLAVLPAALLAAMHWDALTHGLGDRLLAGDRLWMLLLVYPAIKLLHELGHAWAVKSGGGEVHEMGVMLLVLAPLPYVDASAAGAFRSKGRRVLVGAAGMLVELFIAALALFVWVLAEPGLVRSAAWNVILVAGLSTLVFNGNPLLRYDAYYILADLLEIPNLARRSTEYWQWLAKVHLLGARSLTAPLATAGERRWFLVYGPASFAYRSAVMIAISLFIAGEFFFVGALLALWGALAIFVLPLVKACRYVLGDAEIARQRSRAVLVCGGGLGVLLLLAGLLPLPLATHAEGLVWVPENAELRARGDAFVERLVAAPEAWVEEGELLLTSRDAALDADLQQRGARIRRLEVEYAERMFDERLAAALLAADLARERLGLARSAERLAELRLVAPLAGRFRVARAEDLPGRYVRKGELLGYLLAAPPRRVRVVVSQDDIALVREKLVGIEVKIADRLAESWPATILREVPGARDQLPGKALARDGGGLHATDPRDPEGLRSLARLFQFELELPAGVGALHAGTRVHVRFRHPPEALASQWGRRLRQLFLARFDV